MTVAVFLKTIDVLCHLAVQTPEAKRKPTVGPITLQEYCARCNAPTRFGQPISSEAKTQDVRLESFPEPKSSSTHAASCAPQDNGVQRKILYENTALATNDAAREDGGEETEQPTQHRRRRRKKNSQRSIDSLQVGAQKVEAGVGHDAQRAPSFVW